MSVCKNVSKETDLSLWSRYLQSSPTSRVLHWKSFQMKSLKQNNQETSGMYEIPISLYQKKQLRIKTKKHVNSSFNKGTPTVYQTISDTFHVAFDKLQGTALLKTRSMKTKESVSTWQPAADVQDERFVK